MDRETVFENKIYKSKFSLYLSFTIKVSRVRKFHIELIIFANFNIIFSKLLFSNKINNS